MILRILTFLLIITKCHAEELIKNDQVVVLNQFFHYLFENSEAGYVLLSEKPMCSDGYIPVDYFSAEHRHHLSNVILKEGVNIWKSLKKNDSDFIIHISERLNPSGYHQIVVINRPLFLKTINDNIQLFRLVLGPNVTPESLLTEMIRSDNDCLSCLKEDETLIGTVLGFLPQNSIHHTRHLEIENNLLSSPIPPFKSELMKRPNNQRVIYDLALISKQALHPRKILTPSHGFQSIDDEYKWLAQKMIFSSEKLESMHPRFIFGRIEGDKESEQLVKRLEACQDKIIDLLNSKDFFQTILEKAAPGVKFEGKLEPKPLEFTSAEQAKLPFLVAANMWDDIRDENELFQNSFVLGCRAKQEGQARDNAKFNPNNYQRSKALKEIHQKLKETDFAFEKLDDSYQSILPKKLYYRTIAEGKGDPLDRQSKIEVRFVCKNSKGEILSDNFCSEPMKLDLNEVVPGFAQGLIGCKTDEIRELMIHPTLTYGLMTPTEKGDYMHVRVQLISIDHNSPELLELQLAKEMEIPPFEEDKYIEESKNNGFVRGYHSWEHYSRGGFVSLHEVLKNLEELRTGKEYDISDKESQRLINRLHWNLYQQNGFVVNFGY